MNELNQLLLNEESKIDTSQNLSQNPKLTRGNTIELNALSQQSNNLQQNQWPQPVFSQKRPQTQISHQKEESKSQNAFITSKQKPEWGNSNNKVQVYDSTNKRSLHKMDMLPSKKAFQIDDIIKVRDTDHKQKAVEILKRTLDKRKQKTPEDEIKEIEQMILKESKEILSLIKENESIQKQVVDLESESEDLEELTEENITCTSKRKRESDDRLAKATDQYHEELTSIENMIMVFAAMKNLMVLHNDWGQFDSEYTSIDLSYKSINNPSLVLALVVRVLDKQQFFAAQDIEAQIENIVNLPDSQESQDSQVIDDRYVGIVIDTIIHNIDNPDKSQSSIEIVSKLDEIEEIKPMAVIENCNGEIERFFYIDDYRIRLYLDKLFEHVENIK